MILSVSQIYTHFPTHPLCIQLQYWELSIDNTCWAYWCLRGRAWDLCHSVCVCVCVGGELPIEQGTTARSHGTF